MKKNWADGTSNLHGRIEKCMENFGLKNLKGKGPDQSPKHRWEDNIEIHFRRLKFMWTGFILT
jgi:hypothetical protein